MGANLSLSTCCTSRDDKEVVKVLGASLGPDGDAKQVDTSTASQPAESAELDLAQIQALQRSLAAAETSEKRARRAEGSPQKQQAAPPSAAAPVALVPEMCSKAPEPPASPERLHTNAPAPEAFAAAAPASAREEALAGASVTPPRKAQTSVDLESASTSAAASTTSSGAEPPVKTKPGRVDGYKVGTYRLCTHVVVRQSLELASPKVGELNRDMRLRVVELALAEERLRGRIESPVAGWISLVDKQKGITLAERISSSKLAKTGTALF
eukprot:TRINITY_DN38751_c0_g1_i1.p1 TRINITY_DN38751_c0_g1~~TRINITY_DN38751_c0_g1_i1.p1  ORF type:complete len:269 (-),score=58.82 TRINITY_DN38751_c0_g1_i1:26-832(-)